MDISPLTQASTSTPDEAAKNIQTATIYGTAPTNDKDVNDRLAPDAAKAVQPTEAEPPVAEHAAQSTEHTAVMTGEKDGVNDISKLNWVSRQAKYWGDKFNGEYTTGQKISELGFKKMMQGGQLNDEDTAELWQANQDKKSLESRNYDLSGPEEIPADIAAGIVNFGRSIGRDAYKALVENDKYPEFGAQGSRQAIGAIYNSLPENMDEQTKRHIAIGSASIKSSIMLLAAPLAESAIPLFNTTMSPAFVATAMQAPENAVMRMAVNNIGKTVIGMTAMGMGDEATNIVTEEMAKNYNGSSASFLDALVSASEKLAGGPVETRQRLAKAAGMSALTGLTIGAAGNLVSKGSMRSQVDQVAGMGKEFLDNITLTGRDKAIEGKAGTPPPDLQPTVKDVGPEGPKGPATPWTPPKVTPNVGDEVPVEHTVQQAKDELAFHESLHRINDVMNSTKMSDVSPSESRGFLKRVFDYAGITKLYMTMTGARQFGITPEKAAQAANLVDIAKAQHNIPMPVDPEQVMDIARTDPSILDHVSSKPEQPPNPLVAKNHIEAQINAQKRREELFASLGVNPEEIAPPSAPEGTAPTPLPRAAEKEVVPYDFEGAARETGRLLDSIKTVQSQIDAIKVKQESNEAIDKERGAVGFSRDVENKNFEEALKLHDKTLKELNGRVADLKDEVTNALKTEEPGKLLFGHWPEPGLEETVAKANEHLEAPTFTDAIRKVLPKAEVEKLEKADQRARVDRLTGIAEGAKYEMEKIHDIHVAEMRDRRRQDALESIANNRDIQVVEKFLDEKSDLKINVNSLSKEQVEYADANKAKFKGVFTKKGIPLNEAADAVGALSGDHLLRLLVETPTRADVAKAKEQLYAESDEKAIRSQDDLNHTKIIEEIGNDARNHLEWMKFMKDQEWSATKKAIKRIALPLPTIDGLKEQARQMIAKTKIGDLNPHQYAVGEARSNRLAINALLKGDVTTAFRAKESAALNALLRKETMIQIGLVNRTQKFFLKMQRPNNQQILKDAGPLVSNAFTELTTLWNLNPRATPKQLPSGLQGTFLKWAEREIKDGRGDFTFPQSLAELRQSINDMTVEQLRVVDDRGRALFHEAKLNGYLQKMANATEKAEHEYNLDRLEEEVVKRATEHPGFDAGRVQPPNRSTTVWQKMANFFGDLEYMAAGKQYIYRQLDVGHFGGWFFQNFDSEIEGTGENYEKSGFTLKRKYLRELKPKVEALEKAHGNLDKVNSKFFDVPEFAGIETLSFGKNFTKGDLMRAYAFHAQQYTRDRLLRNNGGSLELWQNVFDRYLDEKDIEFMHGVGKLYEDLRPDIKARAESEGRQVDFIEGIDVTHRGITRKGFYNPAQYVHEYTMGDAKAAKEMLNEAMKDQSGQPKKMLLSKSPANEMTHQGYLISRTDNNELLDLSLERIFDGLTEAMHDLSYWQPLRNFFEKTSRPRIVKAMIGVVGEAKVETLIQKNLEIANKPNTEQGGFFGRFNRLAKRYLTHFGNNFAITTLAGKSSVMIKQVEALPEFFNALGPRSMVTFVKTNYQLVRHADKLDGFIGFAKRLDPSLHRYFADIEDNATNVTHDLIPRRSSAPGAIRKMIPEKIRNAASKAAYAIGILRDYTQQAGFFPVTMIDYYLKTSQALTIWNHVMAGHHPDFPLEKLQAMTDEEQFNAVQTVIHHMSTITQIQNRQDLKAPLQAYLIAKPFTPFWNYPRNVLNNTLMDVRRARWKSQEAGGKFISGDLKGAAGDFKTAAGIAGARMFWSLAGLTLLGYAAGKGFQLTKKSINSTEDAVEAGMEMLSQLMEAPFELAGETVPGGGMIKHALDTKKKYARVEINTPETQMIASMVTCYQAVDNFLELSRNPSKMRIRACLEAESYLYQPLPVGAYYKAAKWLDQTPVPNDGTLSLNKLDNALHAMKDYFTNPPEGVDPKFVEGVKALHDQVAAEVAEVPQGTADAIKMAMSNGDWSKPNGLFGFTKDQWQNIKKEAPELGLTDAGRIAKNTEQQQKAMDWSLQDAAKKLTEKEIPVNELTLFGAHRIGVENYEKLYNAPNDEKAKAVLPAEVFEKNPDLAAFKTVGQVKGYLVKTLDESSRKSHGQKTATLTQPANPSED